MLESLQAGHVFPCLQADAAGIGHDDKVKTAVIPQAVELVYFTVPVNVAP